MSGKNKPKVSKKTKEFTGSEDFTKFDTLKISTTSFSFLNSSMGFGNTRFVVPVPDRDDDETQDDEYMKRSLRQMGIRPSRPFDPKKIAILRVCLTE